MTDHDPRLAFPSLPARYHDALKAAATYIVNTYHPQGLVACGSIIRGSPGPNSDLDLYVIHDQPWRQRVQRWFEGIPTELFINPPERNRTLLRGRTLWWSPDDRAHAGDWLDHAGPQW